MECIHKRYFASPMPGHHLGFLYFFIEADLTNNTLHCNMVDYHQDSCQCQFQRRGTVVGDATFDHNHCHYEHRRDETRGPLHRTTSTSIRDCHQHHPTSRASACPGSHRTRCSGCGRSHSEPAESRQDDSADVVRALEEVLDRRSRDDEISRLLDELTQQRGSGSDNNRRVLGDVLGQILDGSAQSSGRPMSTTNRDTLVDLLLRITSSSNNDPSDMTSQPTTMHTVWPAYLPDGIDMMGSRGAWVARGGMGTMWAPGMSASAGYAVPLPRVMFPSGSEGVRIVPRFMTGVWR